MENNVANLSIATVDGEPRILDIDLARSLGFAQPNEIRRLIVRHAKNLNDFSILVTVTKIHHGPGRPAIEYWLNKQQALFITAKSNATVAIEMTVELIRRFDAYERGAVQQSNDTMALLNDPKTLRGLLGNYAERVQQLETVNSKLITVNEDLQQEKTVLAVANTSLKQDKAVLDQIARAEGSVSMTMAAKIIGTPPFKTRDIMKENKWIHKRPGKEDWIANQKLINQGLLCHQLYLVNTRYGSQMAKNQVMVKMKGIIQLAKLMGVATPDQSQLSLFFGD
jgi:phage antirepressor YoqD-like protein